MKLRGWPAVRRYCLSYQGLIVGIEGSAFDEHGSDDVEQFSHTGGQSDFLCFAFFQQSLIESFEHRVELHRHQGRHVQCASQSGISLFGQVTFAPYRGPRLSLGWHQSGMSVQLAATTRDEAVTAIGEDLSGGASSYTADGSQQRHVLCQGRICLTQLINSIVKPLTFTFQRTDNGGG